MASKLLSLLGLARRAGKLTAGSSQIERELPSSTPAAIVLVAEDATSPTAKKLIQRCTTRRIKVFPVPCSMEEIGVAIGKHQIGYVMINDSSFCQGIKQALEEMEVRPYEQHKNL